MSTHIEIKRYALRIIRAQKAQNIPIGVLFDKFESLATPAAVLELIAELESLKKDAARYRTIKKDAISDGSLIERLDCNVQPSKWDSYIDSVSAK